MAKIPKLCMDVFDFVVDSIDYKPVELGGDDVRKIRLHIRSGKLKLFRDGSWSAVTAEEARQLFGAMMKRYALVSP